jgi:spoIIIJ-associated protein
LEEETGIANQFMVELLQKMDVEAAVHSEMKEGNICIDITGDKDGILIGRHGRTLEALQVLINRMVNRKTKEPVRIVVDIDGYCGRRAESLARMAVRVGDRVKTTGKPMTIGPFNAHDRRIIHITLREEPSLRTESIGEGVIKKISIIPSAGKGDSIQPPNRGSRSNL